MKNKGIKKLARHVATCGEITPLPHPFSVLGKSRREKKCDCLKLLYILFQNECICIDLSD